MAVTEKRTRVVGNPGRRAFGSAKSKSYQRAGSGHSSRSNPGQILGFALGNPGRKRGNMAKTKKKYKKASRPRGSKRSYKGNPGHRAGGHHKQMHRRRYKHNPGGGQLTQLATISAFAIVGAVGSKLGTQIILGSNNTGWVGYGANAAVGFGLWLLAEKGMKNRNAATGIAVGTIIQILLRAINDYTPFGSYVNSLGMGDYQMQSFVTPQVLVDPWNRAEIAVPAGWGAGPGQLALPAPGGIVPAGTPMPTAAAGSSARTGTGGLYGAGGGPWGGGLYNV